MQLLVAVFALFVVANAQYDLSHHSEDDGHKHLKYGAHKHLDTSHGSDGYGHHGALEEYGDKGYKKHGHHDIAAHKSYDDEHSHHDSHKKHHDKGYYERNKGHGYEKVSYGF